MASSSCGLSRPATTWLEEVRCHERGNERRNGRDMGDNLPPACAAVSDDLAELALGTLTGRERVAALSHLEAAPAARAEVDELSAAADQLLHLAPAANRRWASRPACSSAWACRTSLDGGGRPSTAGSGRRALYVAAQGGRRHRGLRTGRGFRRRCAGRPRHGRRGELQRGGASWRAALLYHGRGPVSERPQSSAG